MAEVSDLSQLFITALTTNSCHLAPQPRKKEGRAARLFAMENQVKNGGSASELSDAGTLPDAPADTEAAADDGEDIEDKEVANGSAPNLSQ